MQKIWTFIVLFILSASSMAKEEIAVDAVEVRLFYQYSARFSPPVASTDFLNNVFVGEYILEGDANTEPSDTALIDVRMSLPPGQDAFGRVDLLITDLATKRSIARMQRDVGKFSPAGVSHAIFLFSPLGCTSIKVEARVRTVGAKAYSPSKFISLPFVCSE